MIINVHPIQVSCGAMLCFGLLSHEFMWQSVGSGRAAGWPLWEKTRQKNAARQLHNEPTHRAQWASLKLVSPLWKHIEEHEKTPGCREVKEKWWGKSSVNPQISEEAQEGVLGIEEDIHTVASGQNWTGAAGYALKELQPMDSPHWSISWSTVRHSDPDPN